MNLNKTKTMLETEFDRELGDGKRRNIVFWYDAEGEFEDDIDELSLDNAKLLKLTENNSFAVKYQLEIVDTENNYLLYAPFERPNPRENYLLDILKYSTEFSTDKTALIMNSLDIDDKGLNPVFKKYMKFFNNKQREKAFREYEIENYTEEVVDEAILSVLCKLSYPNFEECLRVLLMEEDYESSKTLDMIERFGDVGALWRLADSRFGYRAKEPNLEGLALLLMVTNTAHYLKEDVPSLWGPYVSSERSGCIVFLSNFMNNTRYAAAYDRIANAAEEELNVKSYIEGWEVESYIECDTFKAFDEAIIAKLNEQLLMDIGEFDRYRGFIQARRTKHWYSAFEYEYECLYWAIELLSHWNIVREDMRYFEPGEFIEKYVEEYYKIDTAYRKFYYSFDRLGHRETIMELKDKIENVYVNDYLNSLSIRWSTGLEDDLRGNWVIPGMVLQKDFYDTYVEPFNSRDERVFVIISDGLRYEAGKEFSELLNMERDGSTEISVMQGSVPSYTKLGMASLQPHRKIQIDEKYNVSVDGISIEGIENRGKILKNVSEDSIAVQYRDIIELKRAELRELVVGKNLIYIYHNTIDARGDHYTTEREVFSAVEETFEELLSLINHLVNNVSATNIIITADHGFLYKRGSIMESDKTPKDALENSYDNRRFILSSKGEQMEGTLVFDMKYILGEDTDMKCITPRGANRFKIQGGGANYVHGGTALQEIAIPAIKFKNDRGRYSKTQVKKVDVGLISITRKITNNISFLEFFQTERIGDKHVPRRLILYFADEEGNRVSNENVIIADSRSDKYEDRLFREKFVLKNQEYDRSKKYYLIMKDEEEPVEKEYEKIPFTIDIAIAKHDFGF